ncbi:LysE family translocator [Martelella soudanensis]|uniref:LysE family translocator n=1 Tax=unclassified Martelella TaxID=2629616 RepID=UPI0015DE824D|nr:MULTISPECIES: LysE family transporter [unclassified Martelella]
MSELPNIVVIALAFLVVAVSPGPANIATATLSMRYGRGVGVRFGLGLATGLAFWGVVAATGMGALLQGSIYFLTALKIVGGLYLLWLAIQSARSAVRGGQETTAGNAAGRWFRRGLLLNLSNPKAVLAWMAALSMGAEAGGHMVVSATALCMLIGLANYMFYALIFSLSGAMAAYRRLKRLLEGAVAGLFAMAGFSLLRSAFTR